MRAARRLARRLARPPIRPANRAGGFSVFFAMPTTVSSGIVLTQQANGARTTRRRTSHCPFARSFGVAPLSARPRRLVQFICWGTDDFDLLKTCAGDFRNVAFLVYGGCFLVICLLILVQAITPWRSSLQCTAAVT